VSSTRGYTTSGGEPTGWGGAKEIGVALGIGLALGGLAVLATRAVGLARCFELLSAFVASGASVALTRLIGPFSTEITTLQQRRARRWHDPYTEPARAGQRPCRHRRPCGRAQQDLRRAGECRRTLLGRGHPGGAR
jgi:hypothetical protein